MSTPERQVGSGKTAAGFQEHVAKPVAPATLVMQIAQLAGRR